MVEVCGVPWPVTLDDVDRVRCALAPDHGGDRHLADVYGQPVTWPAVTADA